MGELLANCEAGQPVFDEASCAPTAVSVSIKDIIRQVKRDLFDKEVQSAATYSYLWMADQMGHIGIGLFIAFFLGWIAEIFNLDWFPWWAQLALGAAAVSVWEIKAYFAYAAMWTGLFPSGNRLLAWNAITATIYLIIGVVLGFAWRTDAWIAAGVTAVLIVFALALGVGWLRQKIIWQKAGLPFLFRLANAYKTIESSAACALQKMLDGHVTYPRPACGPIVILTGELGAGKTSLACGVGTEGAFRKLKVRYATFDKLAQMAAAKEDDTGPDNIEYWKWMESELLIIDDVQSGSATKPHRTLERFKEIFETDFGEQKKCLGKRMTVWVLGPLSDQALKRWTATIRQTCGGPNGKPDVLVIRFGDRDSETPTARGTGSPVLSAAAVARLATFGGWALVGASTVALLLSLWWLGAEQTWDARAEATPADAFRVGTLGLELAPYKLVAVLDKLPGGVFRRGRTDSSSPWWIDFGFNPDDAPKEKRKCLLPLGFTISQLLPQSATPTPVEFAGLACAACHSQQIRTSPTAQPRIVVGAGTSTADVIAFGDALKQAVANPALTGELIQATYAKKCDESPGFWQSLIGRPVERLFIDGWLAQFRATGLADASKYDLPFHGASLTSATDIAAGPSRTRPFRSVVRNVLDFPGAQNVAYSKIPATFEQDRRLRPRSQYDGSIPDPVTRSLIAAFTSGATLAALERPAVADNIRNAALYTLTLGPQTTIPTFSKMFPDVPQAPPEAAARGEAVYMAHCASCHGHRPSPEGAWDVQTGASRIHQIVETKELGTDAARVDFRYADMLPAALWTTFPQSPTPLAQPRRVADCEDFERDVPAGYDALNAQRAALNGQIDKANLEGDYALEWYWRERRVPDFERARRAFPAGHTFAFWADQICSTTQKVGYYNNPIPSSYLRAPYLHNGSVPTMRALVNLDKRPARFCRGNNLYDPLAMGLSVRPVGDGEACGGETPFLFDASLVGNSNAGHDYPWTRQEVEAHPEYRADLEDLILYLRTQ